MLTPPGASSIRTSFPAKTRWTPPSCQRLATSAPKARKRSVESVQSNGSGSETADDVVEVVEALVGDPPFVEVGREPARREDEVGRLGRAAVGVAVSDVDELVVTGELLHEGALARLAAGIARLVVAPVHAPPFGIWVDAVRVQLDLDSFALEDRLDQLVEPARDDHDPPAPLACELDEVAKPVTDADVRDLPLDDLLEWPAHRLELTRDDLAEGHGAAVEPVLDFLVDDGIAEVARDRVQQVHLRD